MAYDPETARRESERYSAQMQEAADKRRREAEKQQQSSMVLQNVLSMRGMRGFAVLFLLALVPPRWRSCRQLPTIQEDT
jgi:hypothetical protein